MTGMLSFLLFSLTWCRSRRERCLTCGKTSGTANDVQLNHISKMLKTYGRDLQIWNVPSQVKWSSCPEASSYYVKPFIYWDPERQLGIDISSKRCHKCRSAVAFKECSDPRLVYDVDTDLYFCAAIYRCKGCGSRINTSDIRTLLDGNYIKRDLLLHLPVEITSKGAWTTRLLELVCDLAAERCTPSAISNVLSRARTTKYLRNPMHC